MTNRTYHIWYYGQPQADAVPFTTLQAARQELSRQLAVAAEQGEYPAATVVSIGSDHRKVRFENSWEDSRQ
jgi:hypothetical protein